MEQQEPKPKVGRYYYLPEDIDKTLRVYAAIEDKPISSVVEEALRHYLPKISVQTGV